MYKLGSCKPIDDWWDIVDTGKQNVGPELKLLNDYTKKILARPDTYVDTKKILDCLEIIPRYRTYVLTPFQKFLHAMYSGVFYNDGTVAFREIFVYAGRGFGKNSFASDATLILTSKKHGIPEYNVDMVANSEEQAKTSFIDVYNMIDKHETTLGRAYKKGSSEIIHKLLKCKIKYWTSNAKTKDGLRPGAIIFDEIHEYENYDTLNVFTSALGKVECPRIFYLTTDGYRRDGVLDQYLEIAMDILNGVETEIRMLPVICRAEESDDWEDEDIWEKANPNLRYLPHLKAEMIQARAKARRSVSAKIEFLTKRLNRPVQDPTHLVATYDQIRAASYPIPIDELKKMECIGGVDYADIRDFIGVGLLFKKGEKRYFLHHTFIVEKSLKIKTYNPDLLNRAREKGTFTIIPGEVADPKFLTEWFLKMGKIYRIKTIVADRYRTEILREAFAKEGLPLEDMPVGPPTHNKVAPILDAAFAGGNICIDDDPLMRWYIANVKVVTDGKGNKTYHKIEPELRKTDGFFALIHALIKDGDLASTPKKIRRFKAYNYN